jgi:hypothetical protein
MMTEQERTSFPARRFFDPTVIKPGDIIGFLGNNFVSALVNFGTYGIPFRGVSHVGIMGEATDGRLLLFESTTLNDLPCAIAGAKFDGTQAHELDSVVRSYRGQIWHYPLYRSLYDFERQRLTDFLMGTVHVPYGAMEAFRSGGEGLSFVESLFREADLHRIFCSEWCCAAHAYMGIFPTANVARWNPNRFVRWERSEGILLRRRRLK